MFEATAKLLATLCRSSATILANAPVASCTRRATRLFSVMAASKADLIFVGEGPGADEDAQGLPFVGRAGKLLTQMIEAMGLQRPDVYICNVVKCRPPGNRQPEKDEVEACSPFLFRQLDVLAAESDRLPRRYRRANLAANQSRHFTFPRRMARLSAATK